MSARSPSATIHLAGFRRKSAPSRSRCKHAICVERLLGFQCFEGLLVGLDASHHDQNRDKNIRARDSKDDTGDSEAIEQLKHDKRRTNQTKPPEHLRHAAPAES